MRFEAVWPVLRQLYCNIDVLPIILCTNRRIKMNRLVVSIASAWPIVQPVQMKNADGKVYLEESVTILFSNVNKYFSLACIS